MSYTILRNDSISANIENNNTITSGNKSELLSLVLEPKLSLESHINNPCKEASQNLSALARIASQLCQEKKTVMEALYNLIWMLFFSLDVS